MDIDEIAEPAGYLLSLFGALVMGLGSGVGIAAWLVAKRFRCHTLAGGGNSSALVNTTAACTDTLGAMQPMVLAATAGGLIAFVCGIVAAVYGRQHTQ